jgi:hypothetical protein
MRFAGSSTFHPTTTIDYGSVANGYEDIDGDGCSDYLLIDDATGATQGFLNDHKFGSNSIGTIAPGVGAPGTAVQFAGNYANSLPHFTYMNNRIANTYLDVNGDGLSDYLIVDSSNGAVTAYLNMGTDHFPVWNAQGEIASSVPVAGKRVMFANLNASPYTDLKADYLTIDDNTGAVSAWVNNGFGDTNGDALRFANIDGNGRMITCGWRKVALSALS